MKEKVEFDRNKIIDSTEHWKNEAFKVQKSMTIVSYLTFILGIICGVFMGIWL